MFFIFLTVNINLNWERAWIITESCSAATSAIYFVGIMRGETFPPRDHLLQCHAAQFPFFHGSSALYSADYWDTWTRVVLGERVRLYIKSAAHKLISISLATTPLCVVFKLCGCCHSCTLSTVWVITVLCSIFPGLSCLSCCFCSLKQYLVKVADVRL